MIIFPEFWIGSLVGDDCSSFVPHAWCVALVLKVVIPVLVMVGRWLLASLEDFASIAGAGLT